MAKVKIKKVVEEQDFNLEGEIFEREVKKAGNSAKINMFKEHIGKKVYVVIPKEQ